MTKKKGFQLQEKTPDGVNLNFVLNLDSLRVFVRNVTPVVKETDTKKREQLIKYQNEFFEACGFELKKMQTMKMAEFKEHLSKISDKVQIDEMSHRLGKFVKYTSTLTSPQINILFRSSFVMLS